MSQPDAPYLEVGALTGAQRSPAVDASRGASEAARVAIHDGVDPLASVVQRAPRGVSIERFEPGTADDAYRRTSGRVLALTVHAPRLGWGALAFGVGAILLVSTNGVELGLEHALRLALTALGVVVANLLAWRALSAHVRIELEDALVMVVESQRPREVARHDAARWATVHSLGGQVVVDVADRPSVLVSGLSDAQADWVAQLLRSALATDRRSVEVHGTGAPDAVAQALDDAEEDADDAAPRADERAG